MSVPPSSQDALLGGLLCASLAIYLTFLRERSQGRKFFRACGRPAWLKTLGPHVFSVRTDWGPWGIDNPEPKHLLQTWEEINRMFHVASAEQEPQGKFPLISAYHSISVPYNTPNQDGHAVDIVSRDQLAMLRAPGDF